MAVKLRSKFYPPNGHVTPLPYHLFCDECCASHALVSRLSERGYRVFSCRTERALRGISDPKVIREAFARRAVVLSIDTDFREHARKLRHAGIIYSSARSPVDRNERIVHDVRRYALQIWPLDATPRREAAQAPVVRKRQARSHKKPRAQRKGTLDYWFSQCPMKLEPSVRRTIRGLVTKGGAPPLAAYLRRRPKVCECWPCRLYRFLSES
jgi:hypothetical protein